MRWVTALVGLGGCAGSVGLGDGFEDDLDDLGGCGFLQAYALDADQTTLLEVVLLREAFGYDHTSTFELLDPGVQVDVEEGVQLRQAICQNDHTDGGPHVLRSWAAVSGEVTFTDHVGNGAESADLSIRDVVLASEGEELVVDALSWTDLPIGR